MIEFARCYLAQGWQPIPIPHREKAPKIAGWQNLRLGAEDLPHHFNGVPQNIGILLGEPSGWLTDIDLDCTEVIDLAERFLPQTMVFGRSSKPRSHFRYLSAGAATEQFRDPISREMLVELRSSGAQTVFPGSTHESGEVIAFDPMIEAPIPIGSGDLRHRVARLASAALLFRHGVPAGVACVSVDRGSVAELDAPPVALDRIREWLRMKPAGDQRRPAGTDSDHLLRRARSYVEKMPPAISGQGGHAATFNVALVLKRGFALDDGDAMVILSAYNARCEPPWSPQELRHKLDDAAGSTRLPLGYLLEDERQSSPAAAGETSAQTTEHRTEIGLARRLVAQSGRDLRYCHVWKQWLVYDGCRWKIDDTGETQRRAKQTISSIYAQAGRTENPEKREELAKWALRSEKAGAISAMLALAESEFGIPVLPADLDRNAYLLNVESGTIDLRTGDLPIHRREDLITRLAPVPLDTAALCPTWETFLSQVFEGKASLILFVQRLLGYCATGCTSEHVLVLAYGSGANGKSTLFETVAKIFGDYAGTVPSDLLLAKRGEVHPTERATLFGLRLAICSETGAGRRIDEALMKSLTSEDRIAARRMRENFWSFVPTHKLVVYTNHKPAIRTSDLGTWRRIRLLPFTVTIPEGERDRDLPAKLWGERAGILAWIVRGAIEWYRSGLGYPDEIRAATNEYKDQEDAIAEFLAECCDLVRDAEMPFKDLFQRYSVWCDAESEKAISKRAFGDRLTERGIVAQASKTARLRIGIRLRDVR